MLEASVNGSVYKASGTVQTTVPVLLELNGSVFRQPVPLSGNLLFFRAAASPQLLPSVTGTLTHIGAIRWGSSWIIQDSHDCMFSKSNIKLSMQILFDLFRCAGSSERWDRSLQCLQCLWWWSVVLRGGSSSTERPQHSHAPGERGGTTYCISCC